MSKLLIGDGTNLLHRSFHALRETDMRAKDNSPRWAVHGVLGQVAKYLDATSPSSLLMAFDVRGGCPYRKELAPSYKQGRAETPEGLNDQLELAQTVLIEMGIAVGRVDNWEADDIMASGASSAVAAGAQCVLVSSDKDAHQMISDRVSVYKPEGILFDEEALMKKYSLSGARWVEFAALVGEGADNLTGVGGIGPKRALALIQAFGDIEEAISAPEDTARVVGKKIALALSEEAEVFRRNRLVGTLRRDLELDLTSVKISLLDTERIREVAGSYELFSAGARLATAVARRQASH